MSRAFQSGDQTYIVGSKVCIDSSGEPWQVVLIGAEGDVVLQNTRGRLDVFRQDYPFRPYLARPPRTEWRIITEHREVANGDFVIRYGYLSNVLGNAALYVGPQEVVVSVERLS